MNWVNKDTELYCSFAKSAGNVGCRMMNSAFYYYGLNKIYKSFSVGSLKPAINAVKALNIKGFAITMPYKIEVLEYISDVDEVVNSIGSANTVLNRDGHLCAYNTDAYAASVILGNYDRERKLYILGNGGYAKAVKWAAQARGFLVEQVVRKNWDEIKNVKSSIIYNCTPVDLLSTIDKSNIFIDCLVGSETGKQLANLQASKQFELYTNLEWPL